MKDAFKRPSPYPSRLRAELVAQAFLTRVFPLPPRMEPADTIRMEQLLINLAMSSRSALRRK